MISQPRPCAYVADPFPFEGNSNGCFLFGMFWPLRFVQSDTWTAAVLVDEFDAGHFIAASSWAVIRRPLTSPVKRPVVPLVATPTADSRARSWARQ